VRSVLLGPTGCLRAVEGRSQLSTCGWAVDVQNQSARVVGERCFRGSDVGLIPEVDDGGTLRTANVYHTSINPWLTPSTENRLYSAFHAICEKIIKNTLAQKSNKSNGDFL